MKTAPNPPTREAGTPPGSDGPSPAPPGSTGSPNALHTNGASPKGRKTKQPPPAQAAGNTAGQTQAAAQRQPPNQPVQTPAQPEPEVQTQPPNSSYTILTNRCQDDLGALLPKSVHEMLEVRLTPLGNIYAILKTGTMAHSKTFNLGTLNPETIPRDRAIELLANDRITSLSEMKADIDSLRDLMTDQQPVKDTQENGTQATHPGPQPAPGIEDSQEAQQPPQEPVETLDTQHALQQHQESPVDRIRQALHQDTEEDPLYEDDQTPAQAPLQIRTAPASIATAWHSLRSETPIHPEHLNKILTDVTKEITQAAGKLMPATASRIDLGKGFQLQKDPENSRVLITRTTPAGNRSGVLHPVSDPHGTGVKNASFPDHTHWCHEEGKARLTWLEHQLKEQAANFINPNG